MNFSFPSKLGSINIIKNDNFGFKSFKAFISRTKMRLFTESKLVKSSVLPVSEGPVKKNVFSFFQN